jgi:hypothetical protein
VPSFPITINYEKWRFSSYIQIKGRNVLKLLADMDFVIDCYHLEPHPGGFCFHFCRVASNKRNYCQIWLQVRQKVENFKNPALFWQSARIRWLAHIFFTNILGMSHIELFCLVTKWWELSNKWNSELIIRYAFKPKANFLPKKRWKQDFQDFLLSVWMYIQNKAESQHKMPSPTPV